MFSLYAIQNMYIQIFWNSKLGNLLISSISNLQYRLSVRKSKAGHWWAIGRLGKLQLTFTVRTDWPHCLQEARLISYHVFIILSRLTSSLVLLLTWGSFHKSTNHLSEDLQIIFISTMFWPETFYSAPLPCIMNEMGEVCDFYCSSKSHVMQTAPHQAPLKLYNSNRYSIHTVGKWKVSFACV